jgi:hypothetical protein
MDDHADFDSVSWPHEPAQEGAQPPTIRSDARETAFPARPVNGKRRMSEHNEPQAGEYADGVDLAGIGDGILECTVDAPLKENDGTKDAYVSYLVTTHVFLLLRLPLFILETSDLLIDRLQVIPEVRIFSSATIYRFCISPPNPPPRVSSLRCSSAA